MFVCNLWGFKVVLVNYCICYYIVKIIVMDLKWIRCIIIVMYCIYSLLSISLFYFLFIYYF